MDQINHRQHHHHVSSRPTKSRSSEERSPSPPPRQRATHDERNILGENKFEQHSQLGRILRIKVSHYVEGLANHFLRIHLYTMFNNPSSTNEQKRTYDKFASEFKKTLMIFLMGTCLPSNTCMMMYRKKA